MPRSEMKPNYAYRQQAMCCNLGFRVSDLSIQWIVSLFEIIIC
jgi:hypothetical protein